jgi:hypothetical protein
MIIVIVCSLNNIFGWMINKILMEKFINTRIPNKTDKCRKKKTIGEVKIEDFNEHFKKTSKKFGNIDCFKHDEIVMDFRTMFTKI